MESRQNRQRGSLGPLRLLLSLQSMRNCLTVLRNRVCNRLDAPVKQGLISISNERLKWHCTLFGSNIELLSAGTRLSIYGRVYTDEYQRCDNHIGQRKHPQGARAEGLTMHHDGLRSRRFDVDRLSRDLTCRKSRLRREFRCCLRHD